jgi:multidrug resistance protein, MATE family
MVVIDRTRARLARARFASPGGLTPSSGDLYTESRTLLRIAGPIILSQLGGVGMTTMDTVMVGPLGPEALAAVGLSGALHWALLVITTGTLFGMGPLVSQSFGAGDRRGCREVFVQGMFLALILSVPMFAINTAGERIALTLGQDPAISSVVGDYMWALAWGVPPLLLFFAGRQYLEGMSITKPAMVITFIGLGVNFVANSLLIHGYGGIVEPMGAVGCGWATTVVRWAMLFALAAWIMRQAGMMPRGRAARRWNAPLLRRIVYIGAPTGAQIALEVGFFTYAAVMMGWFGATELGTHQVTINIAATTFMVALGLSLAGSIRVGQLIGAGDVRGAQRVVLLTYFFATVSMGVFAGLFLAIPEFLLGLYTRDPAVVQLGVSLLFMAALFQLFDGAQVAGFSVLRGAADTRVPMFIAAAAYWGIGAPAAYFLGFHSSMGPVGIWAGLVVGLAAATLILAYRVWLVHWRRVATPVAVHLD